MLVLNFGKIVKIGGNAQVIGGTCYVMVAQTIVQSELANLDAEAEAKPSQAPESRNGQLLLTQMAIPESEPKVFSFSQ